MSKVVLLSVFILFISAIDPISDLHDSPGNIRFVAKDIPHFWEAYDKASPEFNPEYFEALYLDKASVGLQLFEPTHIVSAEKLATTVENNQGYYAYVKPVAENLDKYEQQILRYAKQIEAIYPKASFPDVYFVVGRKTTAVSLKNDHLIVGIERFGPDGHISKYENEVWAKASKIPVYITRELVHYQQHYPTVGNLLSQSIQMGAADYLTELITGINPNKSMYALNPQEEAAYWQQFKVQMLNEEMYSWLNDEDKNPENISRILGYNIVKAYYHHAEDKNAAIDDMLNINDFETFVDISQYPDQFE